MSTHVRSSLNTMIYMHLKWAKSWYFHTIAYMSIPWAEPEGGMGSRPPPPPRKSQKYRADLLALVCGVCCEFVTFPLVSWVTCGTWLYRFLIFAPLLTFLSNTGPDPLKNHKATKQHWILGHYRHASETPFIVGPLWQNFLDPCMHAPYTVTL